MLQSQGNSYKCLAFSLRIVKYLDIRLSVSVGYWFQGRCLALCRLRG